MKRVAEMTASELTMEIARQRGGQWYRLGTGRHVLSMDCGPSIVPGSSKVAWPDPLPVEFLVDTDSIPDWGQDVNAALRLAQEMRERHLDPHRLNIETDEQGRRRWLAIFRRSGARAWGATPAEALCRAYLDALDYAQGSPASS